MIFPIAIHICDQQLHPIEVSTPDQLESTPLIRPLEPRIHYVTHITSNPPALSPPPPSTAQNQWCTRREPGRVTALHQRATAIQTKKPARLIIAPSSQNTGCTLFPFFSLWCSRVLQIHNKRLLPSKLSQTQKRYFNQTKNGFYSFIILISCL